MKQVKRLSTSLTWNIIFHLLSAYFYIIVVWSKSLNVYGRDIKMCSQTGMAVTGFTRSGYCASEMEDYGYHHVCVNLKSISGGNFCAVTGQPNWCSGKLPCVENRQKTCPIKNWCVCQWAFSKYIQKAGGCDRINDIVCEATNMAAYEHYRRRILDSTEFRDAFKCLESRCNIEKTKSFASNGNNLEKMNGISIGGYHLNHTYKGQGEL